MPRTEAQELADKTLTEAIEGVLRAYADDATLMDRYMAGEYIVVVTHHGIRDGEEVTMTNVVFKDTDVPVTRALGLARFGQIFMDKFAMSPDE